MYRRSSVVITGLTLFVIAAFLSACGGYSYHGSGSTTSGSSSNSGTTGSSGGSGSGPGSSAQGTFGAGIGGSGQTAPAQFLIATQVPGYFPIPTRINSTGTLTSAKLTAPPAPNSQNNPMGMNSAIDPSGSFLYEAVSPGIDGFSIDRQTGDLTQMANFPVAPSQNFDAIVMDQAGKFLYAYGGGQIFAYTVQPGTGQISPVAGSPFAAASSGQQYFVASDRLAVSQNDKYLYVATSGGIIGYTIDGASGALSLNAGSPFGASSGAAFAIVAPASGFLYETVTTTQPQTNPGIIGYSIDPNTGALTALSGSPFSPACGADNLTSPASGKFLFAASCGMYSIDPATGALAHLAADPSTPNSIWSVFDPAGAFLWVVTTDQNCWHCDIGVTAFAVDSNGNLSQVPNSFFVMQNDMTGGIQSLAITH
jgi:6-phosphogluconolactonase (cycloisomerase 2 family)